MASEYASKVLGAALLQGWTMSAEECKREYCPGCPLMVSKDGKESFCARCDGGEKVGLPRQGLVEPLATSLSSTLNSQTRVSSPTSSRAEGDVEADEDLYEVVNGRDTIPNTPPTPHSRLATPPLLPPVLPTVDVQAQAARRAQTDRASALLAQKMLQGWTLLGEECSNETCHSVPLMRRPPFKTPKKDGEDGAPSTKLIDPRRHCVICQRDYVREGDVRAYEQFIEASSGKTPSTSTSAATVSKRNEEADKEQITHSAAAKKRRFSTQPASSTFNTSKVMGFTISDSSAKGKARADIQESLPKVTTSSNDHGTRALTESSTTALKSIDTSPSSSKPGRASRVPRLEGWEEKTTATSPAVTALQLAVKKLTSQLTTLCETDTRLDVANIAWTSEALARTCKALEDVKDLYL